MNSMSTNSNDNLQKIFQYERTLTELSKMEKVGIDSLGVEITRKCNMKPICKHCMRGKPQNITLSKCAIDNLLNQVSEIGEINITGGEPMLCIERISYLFERVKNNNIVLDAFKIITNGLLFSREFESLIQEIDSYICEVSPNAPNPHITIGVSIDQYHNNNCGKTFIEKCNEAFSACSVSVEPQIFGGNPMRMGLAKTLPKSHTTKFFPSPMEQAAIGVWNPVSGTDCQAINVDDMKGKQIQYILCPIYLSATGKLYPTSLAARVDYKTMDAAEDICDMTNDSYLLDSIKIYNCNRLTCLYSFAKRQLYIESNLYDASIVSIKDEQDAEVDALLNLICEVQARYSNYSAEDRKLASEDMEMIFGIQREYEENEISLSIAMGIWIERLRERGEIINYIVGGSPYTDKRAERINAILDIDDIANNLE